MNQFMEAAIFEGRVGMRAGEGGPFGAVIVRNGEIVARAHNEVLGSNDPTAHSEVLAIRRAAAALGRFDLSDCEIYSSCEPCPMCFAAVHWAKIRTLVFGCTKGDAARIGFDDEFIYEVIRGTARRAQVSVRQENREEALALFGEWEHMAGRRMY